jgi:hypothetical protein
MATRTRGRGPQDYLPRLNGRKLAGWIAAGFSYFTTVWCIQALMGSEGFKSYLIAGGVELFLFMTKGLIFNERRSDDAFGWIAVGIDTLLNAGGMWSYVLKIDDTPSYKMIAVTFNMEAQMAAVWALVLALILGYLLSWGPHRLLRDE